jgi:hypothetical protein
MRATISTIALAFALLALTPAANAQSNGASSPPATIPAQAPAPEAAKKHAKHVYTDDDFASPSADALPEGMMPAFNVVEKNFLPSEPMTAKQLDNLLAFVLGQVTNNRAQTKEHIAQLYLRDDNVPFDGRDDWDRRMFEVWTALWHSMDDFSHKLESIRIQDNPILSESQPTVRDLSQLRDDRKTLIEAWEPSRKLVDQFAVLKHEASEKAAEWRKANPPSARAK